MKELSNYINEKLDINKVNLDEFPSDKDIDTMVNFLKSYNFTEIDYCYDDFVDIFNKRNIKGFIVDIDKGLEDYNLWFGNTTINNIGKQNPFFHINIDNSRIRIYYTIGKDYNLCSENNFLKMIKKYSILK